MARHYLTVDLSQMRGLITEVREELGTKGLEQIMRRAFQRVPGHVRQTLPRYIKEEYNVKSQYVRQSIGRAHINVNKGNYVQCSIPIVDRRGTIGGNNFALTGATRRRKVRTKSGKINRRYKIEAKVLKARLTKLPPRMPSEGRSSYADNPPFVTPKSSRAKGVVLTRKSKNRLPVIRVTGIGVPQMPLNRSREAIQEDLARYTQQRVQHEYDRAIEKIREESGAK